MFLVASWAVSLPSAAQYLGIRVPTEDLAFEALHPGDTLGNWRRLSPNASPQQPLVYSGVDPASQFGPLWSAGVYRPLSARLSSLIETSHADLGDLGAEWSVLGQVGAKLGAGWGVQAGLRHSEMGLSPGTAQLYGAHPATAQLGMLTLEHSWDSFRGAYTVFGSRADSGAAGAGHRFDLQYYYTQRSNIGLSYMASWQLQGVPGYNAFAPLEGSNLGVTGEHWISPTWAVNYRALVQELVPASGLKPQIRFGLRYTF
jgi:hypothetical protein